MQNSKELQEIINKYEEQTKTGQTISPEEACAEFPSLIDAFKSAISSSLTRSADDSVKPFPPQPNDEANQKTLIIESNAVDPANQMTVLYNPSVDKSKTPLGPDLKDKDSLPSIPGYTIHGEIGRGGMGIVYRATQTTLSRSVAIKTLLNSGKLSADLKSRLRKEASALGMLQHNNIIQVYDINEFDDIPYFVMELVNGVSLEDLLSGRLVQPKEAAKFIATLADAMDVAHRSGIVHRDIKPANILIQGAQKPPKEDLIITSFHLNKTVLKVTDFGLAKKFDEEQGQGKTQGVVGTPSYMAPEQANPALGKIGPASDVYAMGVILYEMLVGRPPFMGATVIETLRLVSFKEPVRPSALNSNIAKDLETICLKCLNKQPAKRYETAAELSADLRAYLENKPIKARPAPWYEVTAKWCYRNPALAASFCFVAIAISLGIYLAYAKSENDRQKLAGLQVNLGFERLRANDITKALIWFAGSLDKKNPHKADLTRIGALMDNFIWIRSYVVHDQGVQGSEWSPSGKLYLSYGEDKSIRIHDPEIFPTTTEKPTTVAEIKLINQNNASIRCAFFINDERVLILDDENNLWIWYWKNKPDSSTNQLKLVQAGVKTIASDSKNNILAYTLDKSSILYLDSRGLVDDKLEAKMVVDTGVLGVSQILINSDGSEIVVRSEQEIVRIPTQVLPQVNIQKLQKVQTGITCMAISPNSKFLAVANNKGSIQVWNQGSADPDPMMNFSQTESILCLAFNPDSTLLATGGNDNKAVVWDLVAKKYKYQIRHDGNVTCLAFSPNPKWLITGSDDNTIRISYEQSGRPASSNLVYNATLRFIAPHPRAPLLVVGGDDNTSVLWDMLPKNRISFSLDQKLDQFIGDQPGFFYCRSGTKVSAASTELFSQALSNVKSRYLFFDSSAFKKSLNIIHENAVSITPMGPKGLAILGVDGSVNFYDSETKALTLISKKLIEDSTNSILVGSPLGKYFVLEKKLEGRRKDRSLYTLQGDKINIEGFDKASVFVFSQDDSQFAFGDFNGNIHLLSLFENTSRPKLPLYKNKESNACHNGTIASLKFSPDGKKIASGGEDMFLRLWRISPSGIQPIWNDPIDPQHASSITHILFEESEYTKTSLLLTGGEDNTVRAWDINNGLPINEAMLQNSSILEIQVYKKDNIAVVSGTDGAVYFWDLTTGQMLAPPTVPPGYNVLGYGLLESADKNAAVILSGSYGQVLIQRLQPAPKWANADQLREFAEYHPAFKLQDQGPAKGTTLVPLAGSVVIPLMHKVLKDFKDEFPPLPKLTADSPSTK